MRGNPKTGAMVACQICGTEIYKKRFRLLRDKTHFCSQPCRLTAISKNLIDRKREQAAQKMRTGSTFQCCICGTERYQKRSYIARNVNKTCGNPRCISAYSRSLWGLPPRTDEERAVKRLDPFKARRTNFTGAQIASWIDSSCAECGATDNLCLDHIIPVCADGQSVERNAQTLCQPCNIKKVMSFDMPYSRAYWGSA